MQWVTRAVRWIGRGIDLVAGTFFVLTTVIAFAGVIARYFFASSFPWVEDVCLYIWLSASFLYLPMGYLRDEHIVTDAVYRTFPVSLQRNITRLVNLLTIGVGLFLLYYSARLIAFEVDMGGMSTSGYIPRWVMYTFLPVGFAGLVFFSVWVASRHLLVHREAHSVRDIVGSASEVETR